MRMVSLAILGLLLCSCGRSDSAEQALPTPVAIEAQAPIVGDQDTPKDAAVTAVSIVANQCTGGCTIPPAGCLIKGIVSASGERAFIVPGQQNYEQLVIHPDRGDRWFCSDQEARDAGWMPLKLARKAENP